MQCRLRRHHHSWIVHGLHSWQVQDRCRQRRVLVVCGWIHKGLCVHDRERLHLQCWVRRRCDCCRSFVHAVLWWDVQGSVWQHGLHWDLRELGYYRRGWDIVCLPAGHRLDRCGLQHLRDCIWLG